MSAHAILAATVVFSGFIMHVDVDPRPLTKRAVLVKDGQHEATLTVPAQATPPHTGTKWTVIKTGNATTEWEYSLKFKNLAIVGDASGVVPLPEYETRVPKLSRILMPGFNPLEDVESDVKIGKNLHAEAWAYVFYTSGTLGIRGCHREEFVYDPATLVDPRCGARAIQLTVPDGVTIYEIDDPSSKITVNQTNALIKIENRYTGKVGDRTDHYKHYSNFLQHKSPVRTIVFTERLCVDCRPCRPTPANPCPGAPTGPTIECGSTNWP